MRFIQKINALHIYIIIGFSGNRFLCEFLNIYNGNAVLTGIVGGSNRFNISDETMAVDLIKEVGPKGEFLTLPHTAQNMKANQNWPKIFNRDVESVWVMEGSKSVEETACERVKELLANENPAPLSERVQEELAYIIKQAEEELGVAQ